MSPGIAQSCRVAGSHRWTGIEARMEYRRPTGDRERVNEFVDRVGVLREVGGHWVSGLVDTNGLAASRSDR